MNAPQARPAAPRDTARSPVDVRLQQILADTDFPAISTDALEALNQVSDDDASLQRLANIVLREYALTVKVLRTANSAHYRRTDKHIRSAAHAMLLLGAKTVRHLAGSLLLFEHYRKRSPGLKELMLLSLLTANHAREVAILRGIADPEEANLCGMFRNLGEVLVAAYFPGDYARILQFMERRQTGAGPAAFEILGFRFEELGEAMARNWGMPESVSAGIRSASNQSSNDLLVTLSFAHDLTTAVYRREQDPGRDTVAEVLARYRKRLNLTRDQVSGILQAALRETKVVFASANVSLDGLTLRRQQNAALQELGAPPAPGGDEDDAGELSANYTGEMTSITQLRAELRAEVERLALPESGEELNRVILMALEAAFRGGPFDRVLLCMITPDRRLLRARYGLGDGVEALMQKFVWELDARTNPVVTAVVRRQGFCVPAEREFTKQELQFAQTLGASGFLVVPLVIAGRQLGCLYCDRSAAGAVPDAATIAYVRTVCDAVLRGIQARKKLGRPETRDAELAEISAPSAADAAPLLSAEHKSQAVLRVLRGEAAATVAEELRVSAATLERWRESFLTAAVAGLQGD